MNPSIEKEQAKFCLSYGVSLVHFGGGWMFSLAIDVGTIDEPRPPV
jgi:hypothetical protein